MTYRQLADLIATLSDEQLDMTATFSDGEEYAAVSALCFSDDENDILDANHPYFSVPR